MEPAGQAIIPIFHHEPLDHEKQSVRLVQLLPDLSPDGLIQCKITHATVADQYTCLSYSETPIRRVLINNQLFHVRQNLFDFLSMRREVKEPCLPYWIDALCIDQVNIGERNHQVAQMGDIFSRAQSVHIWLGTNKALNSALHMLQDPDGASPTDWMVVQSHKKGLEELICNNEYWNRAWIIQEIFMAQNVLVWADTVTLRFEYLHWTVDYFYLSWKNSPIARFKLFSRSNTGTKSTISTFSKAKAMFHGAGLVALLAHFRDQKCEVPRDRVFSLLAMCGQGRQVPVDYKKSDAEVALDVLKHGGSSMCACAPFVIPKCLGLLDDYFISEAFNIDKDVYLEVTLPKLYFDSAIPHPRTAQILSVDGINYLVHRLDLLQSLRMLDTSRGSKISSCVLLKEVLFGLFSWYQVIRIEDHSLNALREANRASRFNGNIRLPTGHTLSSLLRDKAPIWIEKTLVSLALSIEKSYDEPSLYTLVNPFGLEQKLGKPFVLRIRLESFIEALQKANPETCPMLNLSPSGVSYNGQLIRYRFVDKNCHRDSGLSIQQII